MLRNIISRFKSLLFFYISGFAPTPSLLAAKDENVNFENSFKRDGAAHHKPSCPYLVVHFSICIYTLYFFVLVSVSKDLLMLGEGRYEKSENHINLKKMQTFQILKQSRERERQIDRRIEG